MAFRELKGCLPPFEDPSLYRFHYRLESPQKVIFWGETFIKDFKLWAPSDTNIRIISGGSRVPISQFDRGTDIIQQVTLFNAPSAFTPEEYDNDWYLELMVEMRDHRSFQIFTWADLSKTLKEDHGTEGPDRV